MHRHTQHTHRGIHNPYPDIQTGSSQKQGQRRRVSGRGELCGEAQAELDYSEKEGRVFREWEHGGSRRKGTVGPLNPKSRENPSCMCHAL